MKISFVLLISVIALVRAAPGRYDVGTEMPGDFPVTHPTVLESSSVSGIRDNKQGQPQHSQDHFTTGSPSTHDFQRDPSLFLSQNIGTPASTTSSTKSSVKGHFNEISSQHPPAFFNDKHSSLKQQQLNDGRQQNSAQIPFSYNDNQQSLNGQRFFSAEQQFSNQDQYLNDRQQQPQYYDDQQQQQQFFYDQQQQQFFDDKQQKSGQQQFFNEQQSPIQQQFYNDKQQSMNQQQQHFFNDQQQSLNQQQPQQFFNDQQQSLNQQQPQQFINDQQQSLNQQQQFYNDQQQSLNQQQKFHSDKQQQLNQQQQLHNDKQQSLNQQQQFYNDKKQVLAQQQPRNQQSGISSQQHNNKRVIQEVASQKGQVKGDEPSIQIHSVSKGAVQLSAFDNRAQPIVVPQSTAMHSSSVVVSGLKNMPLLPAMVYNGGAVPVTHAAVLSRDPLYKGGAAIRQHLNTPFVRYVYSHVL